MKTLAVALTISATLGSGTALAHEFWLAPSTYAGAHRRVVEISALAGTGFRGERLPWSPVHCAHLVARAASIIDLTRAASIGDVVWARFAPADDGGTMLAFESKFTPIELPAEQFDAYLKDEGLTGPLDARNRGPAGVHGRERYRRCAKAWLPGRDLARAVKPVGLPLEIVPQVPPGTNPQLPLLILWDGRPLPGALVKAWRAPLGAGSKPTDGATRDSVGFTWQGRSDSRGQLIVPVISPGEWIVSVVHMVPCRETSEADWESTWASLTFERGPRAKGTP
jgi:hypothetical protein